MVVGQRNVEDLLQLRLQNRIIDAHQDLDATIEVAGHEVGRTDEKDGLARTVAIGERVDPRMFEVSAHEAAIHDEAQFHQHARTMGYPDLVVRGAWSGISTIAARYTNGDWPFDGSMIGGETTHPEGQEPCPSPPTTLPQGPPAENAKSARG